MKCTKVWASEIGLCKSAICICCVVVVVEVVGGFRIRIGSCCLELLSTTHLPAAAGSWHAPPAPGHVHVEGRVCMVMPVLLDFIHFFAVQSQLMIPGERTEKAVLA